MRPYSGAETVVQVHEIKFPGRNRQRTNEIGATNDTYIMEEFFSMSKGRHYYIRLLPDVKLFVSRAAEEQAISPRYC